MEELLLYLPFPPTVNSYYKHTRRGISYLDKKVGVFRAQVLDSIKEQCPGIHIDYSVYVEVTLFMPDRRRRDLDNYMKGLLDAIVHAGLLEDDSLINQLHIFRGEVISGGSVLIEFSESAPILKFKPG